MKTPICDFCLESKLLCLKCSKKLRENEITNLDIDVSRFLNKLEKKLLISDVDLLKTYDINGYIILLVHGNIASVIGKSGKVVRMLSDQFRKRFRAVAEGDFRNMIQDLVFPARIYGINVLHTPKGEKYIVMIPRKDKSEVLMDEETLKKVASILFNKEISIKFS